MLSDLRSAGRAVRLLSGADVPADFRDRLAQRLAAAPPPSVVARAREWVRINVLWGAGHVLRPALALGAVAVAAFVLNVHGPSVPPTPNTPVRPADARLITQCVTLHQTEVASEPVADWAAVNLAERMDDIPAADDGLAGDPDAGI
jgi:hypothetical protein